MKSRFTVKNNVVIDNQERIEYFTESLKEKVDFIRNQRLVTKTNKSKFNSVVDDETHSESLPTNEFLKKHYGI